MGYRIGIGKVRYMRIHRRKKEKTGDPLKDNMDLSQRYQEVQKMKLEPGLEQNLQTLQQVCGYSQDLKIRRFNINGQIPAALVYLDDMVNTLSVEEILRVLMVDVQRIEGWQKDRSLLRSAIKDLLIINSVEETDSIGELFLKMTHGNTALLVEGQAAAFVCGTVDIKNRDITEPLSETNIRGPRDGFVESLCINITLIRRRIRVPHLWIETFEIGSLTKTQVAIAYIKGLADEKMLEELRSRLERIDTDAILESGYIEQYIEDQPFTLFPLTLRTERPDIVCSSILSGRVAVLVTGSPHVLVLPADFPMFFQASDDYYEKPPQGSFVRILRWIGAIISVFLPGFYVAVVNFHQELLPTALLLRVTASREGVPFPVIAEILIMEVLFEVLREAGIRLPVAVGPAISIVGALVLGEAAIRAGIVSPAVVIVVAMTAIANFSNPVFSMAIVLRILRFAFTILAAVFGLFGIQFGILLLVVHLCSLRSLGIPYMSPLAPNIPSDMKDNFLLAPIWARTTRPKILGRREPVRQSPGQMPHPGKHSQEEIKGGNKDKNR
ncbi:MAG: spore germination protein [Clostridiales bacterium]|jgi:spore germination protein KA|nr:spore germination protein [Clostridiales bacterium]